MGANIDYAIVIASRYQELKTKMDHRSAITETMNFAFPDHHHLRRHHVRQRFPDRQA